MVEVTKEAMTLSDKLEAVEVDAEAEKIWADLCRFGVVKDFRRWRKQIEERDGWTSYTPGLLDEEKDRLREVARAAILRARGL